MAADGLEQAGKAAGIEIHVEPQGSGKVEWLDPPSSPGRTLPSSPPMSPCVTASGSQASR